MVTKSGVYEQYHPLTGEGFGAVGLGMSSLVVDWIYRLGRLPVRAKHEPRSDSLCLRQSSINLI
jgi:hypothetical protein